MVATLVVIIINKQIAMANMANVCAANVKLPLYKVITMFKMPSDSNSERVF